MNLCVGGLFPEVGLGPQAEEDLLGEHVGCWQIFATVQHGAGRYPLDGREGEGILETLLNMLAWVYDIVITMVELSLVGPVLSCRQYQVKEQGETTPDAPTSWPSHMAQSGRKYPRLRHWDCWGLLGGSSSRSTPIPRSMQSKICMECV